MDITIFFKVLSNFHFIRPWWLLLLIPFALVVFVRWYLDSRKSAWENKLPEHLRKPLTVGEEGSKKFLPLILWAIMAVLIVIISAGPTWKKQPSPFGEDKTPALIVLDGSNSMLEKDLAPSRLERAKQKTIDLLQLRSGGKTGLITYSGSAHLAMPLTQDIKVFKPMLYAISPEVFPQQGKNAKATIPLIEKQFKDSPVPGSIILISDAVNGDDISAFSDYLKDKDYQLLILGVGDPSRTSNLATDFDSLKSLASQTDGSMVTVSADDKDIQALNRRINFHEQTNSENNQPWQDMGYYLLLPLALIFLFWSRRGWVVQWCLLMMVSFTLFVPKTSYAQQIMYSKEAQQQMAAEANQKLTLGDKITQKWMDLWLTPDQQGQWYLNRNQYKKAAQHFKDPLRKGVALYYAGAFKDAHTVFIQGDSKVMQFNAANALIRQRNYVAARTLLKTLHKKYPDDKDIKHNLDFIVKLIDEINQFSGSQASAKESSKELTSDQPKPADGAEEKTDRSHMQEEKPTIEELLNNEKIANKWLEKAEGNPKQFLQAKFNIQLQQQQSGEDK